jgi:hypothetical protein
MPHGALNSEPSAVLCGWVNTPRSYFRMSQWIIAKIHVSSVISPSLILISGEGKKVRSL